MFIFNDNEVNFVSMQINKIHENVIVIGEISHTFQKKWSQRCLTYTNTHDMPCIFTQTTNNCEKWFSRCLSYYNETHNRNENRIIETYQLLVARWRQPPKKLIPYHGRKSINMINANKYPYLSTWLDMAHSIMLSRTVAHPLM